MLRALFEAGIRPDVVLGTSVGAVNAAVVAAVPGAAAVKQLEDVWLGLGRGGVFGASLRDRLAMAVRSRTHLYSSDPLRELLEAAIPVSRIEDLWLPFQCVAASIERAVDHWFTEGPLIDAVLASCAPAYDDIRLTVFPHGAESIGLAGIREWQAVLGSARQHGQLIAIEPDHYPRHFRAITGFHRELSRLPRVPALARLGWDTARQYLATHAARHKVTFREDRVAR